MPPRKPGKGKPPVTRERKPAMKRGGRSVTKAGAGNVAAAKSQDAKKSGGGGKKLKGLTKAKIPKGDAAAHKQQSYYGVDSDDEDFAGRGAREHDEFDNEPKNQFEELPSDFEDEEIDEDEAFTEEDKARYGDVNFDSFTSGKKKQKRGGNVEFDDDIDGVGEEAFSGDEEEDKEDDADEEDDDDDVSEDEEELLLDSDEDELDEDASDDDEEDEMDVAPDDDGDVENDDDDDDDDDENDSDRMSEDSEETSDDDDDDTKTNALLDDVVGEVREKRLTTEKTLAGRRLKRGLTEATPESEFGTAPGVGTGGRLVGGGGVLSVASLVAASLGNAGGSVDDDGTAKAGKNPLAGARKRLDRLGSGALNPSATPLPKTIAERVERKAAYEATGVAVGEWQDVVKANREKPTLKFTDQERDKMNRVKSLASMNANFSAGGDGATDFEKLIMAKIKSSGLETGKDVEKAEDLQLNALTAEEANERRSRLAKMRNLLFRHELKHKRVKGIKSKTFHRHNRKTGAVKMIGGDGEEIGEDDDTLEGLEGGDSAEQRREYLRAQERMLLKHKNTSRWAKRAIRKGLAHLPGTKEAIAEQLRLGQELRRKIGIGGEGGGGGGGEDDEANSDSETDASDSDDDDAAPLDATQARRKQLAKAKTLTLKALEQGEQDTEEQGGLFALPFMAKALRKKREAAENEAKALLEDIENAEREAARGDADVSDDDETNKNAAGDWGGTARGFEEPSRTEEDAGPVTRRAFGGVSTKRQTRAAKVIETKEEEDDDDDDKETDIGTELTENDTAQPKLPRGASRAAARAAAAGASGATQAPDLPAKPLETPRELPRGAGAAKARHAARQAGRAGMVAVGDDDDDAVAIYATAGGDAFEENDEDDPLDDTNEQLLARAFAGDDVVANFETEKTNEVESELPKTEVQKLMPGWGGWAEEQAKRPVPKWQIESEKKAAVEKAKALKARKDADLKKVIISEKYDKKAAAFNVEHLPHGFESKQVYEGQMRHPLGGDVNTDKSFRDLTRPKVLKNAGAVIRPMPAPKKRKVGK